MSKITITKAELTDAFTAWCNDFEQNPDNFDSLESIDPVKQTDTLLEYLKQVRTQKEMDRNR